MRETPTVVWGLPGVPRLFRFSPGSGGVGVKVVIYGASLKHATSVTFHNIGAHFTIVSNKKIVATVPKSATSGKIRVTTPGGTATSGSSFVVTA